MRIRNTEPKQSGRPASTLDQLVALRDELAQRRREVLDLDARSASLAATDAEGSIAADQRARALEKLIARRESDFEALKARAREEKIAERCLAIHEAVAAEERKVGAFLSRLLDVARAFSAAGAALSKVAMVAPEAWWQYDGRQLAKKIHAEGFKDGTAEAVLDIARSIYMNTLSRVHTRLLDEARGTAGARSTMSGDAFAIIGEVDSRLPPWSPEIELPEAAETPQPAAGELALQGGAP